ncbi:FkbM family methyltransferase [Acinetobacter sp.]|uniref:FkbM family methyltransferase n=1 Tax=Acinetobacter sp. TaxID=472 RepID=UPI000C5907CE|nr:FkbM family methyltransferase [Acinetobacter sp.]MBC70329.1 hypothetical protein [Acinetobacter sp.]|tara:strand:+ start:128 stop:916 length:789 start_codon:yes stop_codon:yes gene_type:complete
MNYITKLIEYFGFERKKDFTFFLINFKKYYHYIKKDPYIIYVGAHNGSAALKIKNFINYKHIYLFEPNKTLFDEIINLNIPNATAINKAVDNQNKSDITFNIAGKDSISSLINLNKKSHWYKLRKYQFNNKNKNFVFKTKVETIKISTALNGLRISKNSILIIDTQGNTLRVLKSAEKQIKANLFDFIVAEVIFDNCYQNSEKIMNVEMYLAKYGYGMIGQHSSTSLFEDCGQLDLIFGSTTAIKKIEKLKKEKYNNYLKQK